jgi:cation diffusion facilitator family transporter
MRTTTRFSFIPEYGDINDPFVRAKYGYLEGMVSIVGNVFLFIVKLSLGLFINSIALIADSIHSLSDVGTSVVVIVGFSISKKPSDTVYPFGYGRVEYIATVIIAVLLVITGFGFIQQSIERILESVTITHQQYAIVIGVFILLSAVVKEVMARFSFALGKKINSDILFADAWHHRSDALSSIGVGLSIIGASFGYPVLDPLFGIIVSFIIVYVGVNLGKKSVQFLIGKSPDSSLVASVQEIGQGIEGVKNIHDISLHDYGTQKIITLHAEVDKNLLLDEAHAIADKLEEQLLQKMHYSTIIHVEPTSFHRDTQNKKQLIEKILEEQKSVISFHNIRIIRRPEKDDISMHLVVNKEMNVEDSHQLCHQIEILIQNTYGSCDVHIHLEPCHDAYCSICTSPCDKKKSEK